MRASDYARLPTERPNPRTRELDLKSPLEIVRLINRQDARVALAVRRESRRIARAVEVIARAWAGGSRLFFVGAGTSGRLDVLEAAECPPTFNTPPSRIQAIMAGGKSSVFRSREGAEDDARAGAAAIARARPGDVVVGVAASGVTAFVRGALARAKALGARTILVTSGRPTRAFAGSGASGECAAEIVIAPEVGPEVIAGSTRMKSGTAAKLVLNTLTTAAMIRVGKVYDHWMVDLKPTSRKLRLRAARIVAQIGRVGPRRAAALLRQAGGSVKVALVMARLGVDALDARRRLERHGGSLRKALG